jgi:phenylpropionate dioxygenase-like ring-hydroxylating dioxygenase large terminal subunit
MSQANDNAASSDFYSGYTEAFGLDTGPVATAPYYCPQLHERENKQVFRRSWLMVCRVEELPEDNCFIVREFEVANASVLVTRQKGGKISAFHNVCSHRGNKVALESCGKKARMVCRYHNWMYSNDGELLNVPDEASFFDFDKKQCGLTRIASGVWNGWVFINFQKEPEVSLEEYLGDFGVRFGDMPTPNSDNCLVIEARLKANWKVLADAFAESYHIPAIHPKTIGTTFSSDKNPYSHPINFSEWGPHKQVSTYGNPDYQPSPKEVVEKLAFKPNEMGNVLASAKGDSVEDFLAHPGVNPLKSKEWAVDITWIFPNFMIDLSPGGFWTHQFWPLSVNETRWEARFYLPKAKTARERFQQEHYASRLLEIMVEDLTNTERTQKGFESEAKSHIYLQDGEVAIRHHLATIAKWIEADTVKAALS